MPEPETGERDALVRIAAAGVNPLDAKIMAGEFRLVLPYKPPFVLGNDLAGVVERAGPGVHRFAPGDEVYARPDKDRIGSVSIGLNLKAELGFLQNPIVRGAVSIATGANDDLGGTTKMAFPHQQTLRAANLSLDGKPVVKAGKLLLP